MKIYLDLQKQAITKTTDENIYQGDIYSNAFEVLFYNYTDSNWFPTMSQLAPNGRKAGEFTADALDVGESHEYTEDGVTYLKFTFTMGASWVLMKGRSEFYIWFNRLGGAIVQKKCVGVVNIMIDHSTEDYFIADPTFNPNVKAYIDACIAELGDGSPKYFDTASNIANCTEDKGLAVATDTGYIWVWNDTDEEYKNTGYIYLANVSAYYTKTEADNTFAPKSTAIAHTGSQLKDYSGNDIYPNLNDGQVTTDKILNYSVTTDKLGFSSVTNSRIKDNDIDASVKVRDASITTNKLATGCVNSSKLADDSVFTAKIVDGNVTTAKIANNAITNEKIGYHAVDVTKIDDNAIQTSKIADYQVTKAKIANYNVDETKVTFYCDDDYVKEDYNFSGKTAVFFGDSITIGTESAPTPYPNYLCNKVGMTLSGNYAVGGAGYGVANNQILTQIQNASIKNSDYVFISAGINDYLSGVSIDYLIYKVNEVLDYVLNNYTGKIILITPIKDNLSFVMNIPLQLYRNTITECGISKDATNRITIIQGIKFNFPNRNSSDTYKSLMFVDTLHPTDFAYKTVYVNGILKALK